MKDKTAILHIGLHKTGSTSFQAALSDNRRQLRRQGVDVYRGAVRADNHVELFRAAVGGGLETLSGRTPSGRERADLRNMVQGRIADFVDHSPADRLIFTTEALSLLRSVEELQALKSLFPEGMRFRVILVLRDKAEWLASYEKQIRKVPGRVPSDDPASSLYVGPGTWLTDFEGLIAVYRQVFGDVTVLDYRREGMLAALLQAAGVDLDLDERHYIKNLRGQGHGLRAVWVRIRTKLYRFRRRLG